MKAYGRGVVFNRFVIALQRSRRQLQTSFLNNLMVIQWAALLRF